MNHPADISLRHAAAAFGPCAGGTDNALRQIIDKLEDDETFWRKFVGDKANMRSDIIAMESSDWFRNYSSLSSQHPAGIDPEFDKFRDAVECILYRSDDLVMDYDEVRSIWFPQDFRQFIPNAELATTWSFTQALAWVATKDLGIVGAIDHLVGIAPTGWLAVLLSERCTKCEKEAALPRWEQCRCLTNAFSTLCATSLPQPEKDSGSPKLEVSAKDGWIKSSLNSSEFQFDPADIRSIFKSEKSGVFTPEKKRGAKVITDEANELWLERRKNGQNQPSANREAELIHRILTERHQKTGRKVPNQNTIRKRIKDWLDELGEAE